MRVISKRHLLEALDEMNEKDLRVLIEKLFRQSSDARFILTRVIAPQYDVEAIKEKAKNMIDLLMSKKKLTLKELVDTKSAVVELSATALKTGFFIYLEFLETCFFLYDSHEIDSAIDDELLKCIEGFSEIAHKAMHRLSDFQFQEVSIRIQYVMLQMEKKNHPQHEQIGNMLHDMIVDDEDLL